MFPQGATAFGPLHRFVLGGADVQSTPASLCMRTLNQALRVAWPWPDGPSAAPFVVAGPCSSDALRQREEVVVPSSVGIRPDVWTIRPIHDTNVRATTAYEGIERVRARAD